MKRWNRDGTAALRRDNEKIAPVEAIELQVAIMRDEKAPPSVRLAASMALHDRGYGKAAQIGVRHLKK